MGPADAGQPSDGGGVGRGHATRVGRRVPVGGQHGARGAGGAQAIEGHEVGVMVGVEHGGLPRLGGAGALEQGPQHPHGGQTQHEGAGAGQGERLDEQGHDLRVGGRARGADALHAALGELTGLGLVVGLGLAEHPLGVAEAQRAGLVGQARGAHTGDLESHIGAHGQQVVMGVEELEGGCGHAAAGPHDVHYLQGRRLDGSITALGEQVGHGAGDDLAGPGLLGQHVTESRWGDCVHKRTFLVPVSYGNTHIMRLHATAWEQPRPKGDISPAGRHTDGRPPIRMPGLQAQARAPGFQAQAQAPGFQTQANRSKLARCHPAITTVSTLRPARCPAANTVQPPARPSPSPT